MKCTVGYVFKFHVCVKDQAYSEGVRGRFSEQIVKGRPCHKMPKLHFQVRTENK
jgi:hypothetical protein